MNMPTGTYRIQFRSGMTFDRAAGLVPYLKRLGISHLYASPVFTATAGSTHGYDVTDPNEIEPSLGGREAFDRMVTALKKAGLGLILDIVPNHMAASLENAWWRDVIEKGENSRYARYFDIDWARPLTLPFLGDTFDAVLENGEIAVKPDPKTGRPALVYYDSAYPLAPETWEGREAEILRLTDKAEVAQLHARQSYRLMAWRDAPHDLSYRRFFEITGLVGVRVEDSVVFDDTHRLILELVHSGVVDGLRVDHVDGLADPKAYLERLRQEAGPACYITVEKILAEGESIPADWPVSGATGYEFMATLPDALVDGEKIGALRTAYDDLLGKPVDWQAEWRAAKVLMADKHFAGEFTTLVMLAMAIAKLERVTLDETDIRSALRELLVAFPVYRTYGTASGLPPADQTRLQQVADKVRTGVNAPSPEALDYLLRLLAGAVSETAVSDATAFRVRFQQLTGPLMAKSVEDTLFFRQHMALALNEVGAEPLPRAFSLDRFHKAMKARLERQPDALSATSTHDTKRGEDARARLYSLSEAPEHWAGCVARWRQMLRSHVTLLDDGPAPEPAVEWMLYQTLAGVWPATLQVGDEKGLKALRERFLAFVEKALREAKLRTSWRDNNDAYEKAVRDYACYMLSPHNPLFLADFSSALQPFIRAGWVNSLTQTIIKLTAPGVPDIYQGSEAQDFSLADPDNRREPDFAELQRQLEGYEKPGLKAGDDWPNARLKQHVIAKLLHLRQQWPSLFRRGNYLPLTITGIRSGNMIAFARQEGAEALIVIVPRLLFDSDADSAASRPTLRWAGTEIALPASLAHRRYREVFSQQEITLTDRIDLASIDETSLFLLLKGE